MSTGDPNAREEIPFPNPLAPVPPGPQFVSPPEPQVLPPAVAGSSLPVDLARASMPGMQAANGGMPSPHLSPEEVGGDADAFLTRMYAQSRNAQQFGGVMNARVLTVAELNAMIQSARGMPYERLLDVAEMVVWLAKTLADESTAKGRTMDFNQALRSINKVSDLLANQPGAFAQVATLFQ